MKHIKACISLRFLTLSLMIVLCGCSNNNSIEQDNSLSDDGYKPVIMYNGSLYWLSVEKPPITLPEGFVDSQMKIKSCVDDPMQLPKEELSTSTINCSIIGISVLINPNDDELIITATDNGNYQAYEKNQ